ncbi:MAG: Glu/Leu/Phe/Val dehydrogenase dimerization domain-containing protein [Pseudomonadota bacterium]|nr:Glu/Leu/Phe/Val dehydrogenase dimerization domain-containing protein [Pseudomonadota bacterium]
MEADLFDLCEASGTHETHFRVDPETGMRAIIAIHSTTLGPALGGCRFRAYPDTTHAVQDALRLARGMSYKAAMSGLPLGGGKAVMLYPEQTFDRARLFTAFGRFVESLGGRYITAVDSGSSVADMDVIGAVTPHVSCTSQGGHGDPSSHTAYGVLRAMASAAAYRFGDPDLAGRHVAIQGVGNVGYHLAGLLHQQGAQLTVADTDNERVARCVREFSADAVSSKDILSVDCDILAPCAMGAVLDASTVDTIRAKVIGGGANNQLAEPEMGRILQRRGVLYIPDYVANAGGIIQIMGAYRGESPTDTRRRLSAIYETVSSVIEYAERHHLAMSDAADQMAAAKIGE